MPKAAPEAGPSRSPPNRRERNKQEKLRRIRQAAAELFEDRGYEDTTTQAIADRADVGAGTLFLYAPTKEDLLALVMGNDIRETVQQACASIPPDAPPAEQAYYVYSRLIRYHARKGELSRYYVRERTIPRVRHKYPNKGGEIPPAPAIVDAVTEVIRRSQRAGQVRSRYAAAAISWRLFALYYGVLVHLLVGRTSERETLRALRESFQMLFDGVGLHRAGN